MGDFLKSLGGKIATGAISLAVVASALAWYETDPAVKHQILSDSGKIIGWFLLIAVAPWASFALIGWVSRQQNNLAGATLVTVLTIIEAALLAWLFAWSIRTATEWILYAAAILLCGVYNLFACDWIAEVAE